MLLALPKIVTMLKNAHTTVSAAPKFITYIPIRHSTLVCVELPVKLLAMFLHSMSVLPSASKFGVEIAERRTV